MQAHKQASEILFRLKMYDNGIETSANLTQMQRKKDRKKTENRKMHRSTMTTHEIFLFTLAQHENEDVASNLNEWKFFFSEGYEDETSRLWKL